MNPTNMTTVVTEDLFAQLVVMAIPRDARAVELRYDGSFWLITGPKTRSGLIEKAKQSLRHYKYVTYYLDGNYPPYDRQAMITAVCEPTLPTYPVVAFLRSLWQAAEKDPHPEVRAYARAVLDANPQAGLTKRRRAA